MNAPIQHGTPRRGGRWLRFRLRTLFILMTLVAVATVWVVHTRQRIRKQEEAVAWIRKEGGWVWYDHQLEDILKNPNPQPPGPDWLRSVFGPQWGIKVVNVSAPTNAPTYVQPGEGLHTFFHPHLSFRDNDLTVLQSLPDLRFLGLSDQRHITDAGLAQICQLQQLEGLTVGGCPGITDAGLAPLAQLQRLASVNFPGSAINGSGLAHLRSKNMRQLGLRSTRLNDASFAIIAKMTELEFLSASHTPISDTALAQLTGLRKLKYLDVGNSMIGDAGLKHLAASQNSLELLDVSHTQVTPFGLFELARFKNLKTLALSGQLADWGFEALISLPSLQALYVDDELSPAAEAQIKQALPNCTIHRERPFWRDN